jgi:hypothetical protein
MSQNQVALGGLFLPTSCFYSKLNRGTILVLQQGNSARPSRCAGNISQFAEVAMKTVNAFQKWMIAVTFAEAGEWETAKKMIPVPFRSRAINQFQKIFMAAAFAEEGLHGEAISLAEYPGSPQAPSADEFLKSLGLGGVRMTYGVFATESGR